MKPIKRVYYAKYTKCVVGYRLLKSRTGNGTWQDGDNALPECVRTSIDRTVNRHTDAEMAAIYDGIFAGKPTTISGKGYEFTVKGSPRLVLRFDGTIEPEKQPLDPVPEDIKAAAAKRSTGRWQWEKAHLTITGKDADLEPWGQQAAELVGIRGKTLYCIAHIGKTFAGDDVCLNLTKAQERSTKAFEAARDLYLEQAQEVVCGCGVAGEWSGDDWFMSEAVPYSVRLRSTAEDTARAVAAGVERALKPAESELVAAEAILDHLSGWKDVNGKHCKEGCPPKGSVSDMLALSVGRKA